MSGRVLEHATPRRQAPWHFVAARDQGRRRPTINWGKKMQKLNTQEMQDVTGGGLCGDLLVLGGGSCLVGLFVACALGLTGYVALCLDQQA
jgi:hypothetical protein